MYTCWICIYSHIKDIFYGLSGRKNLQFGGKGEVLLFILSYIEIFLPLFDTLVNFFLNTKLFC